MTVIVRTSSAPETLAPALRNAIRRMDSNLPVPAIRTMQQIVMSAVAERRFQMLLTSVFAGTSLVAGAARGPGVVSYTVACRTRDIGLRLALGATRQDIMRWVVSIGMRPVVIGLVIGIRHRHRDGNRSSRCALSAFCPPILSLLEESPDSSLATAAAALRHPGTPRLAIGLPSRRTRE